MTLTESLFETLAFTTWDAIENAYTHKISLGEDAITSINLLALKNASFPNLAIVDTRPSESTKGCDFEFWIGNNKSGWHRYAIQAKKISVSSGRYDSLNHIVGDVPQIQILEQYASSNNAIPLYCLFNFSNNTKKPSTSCFKYLNIKEFGCSVTPLSTVKYALNTRGSRTFKWFHERKETLPWSCLVRCTKLHRHWTEEETGIKHNEAIHEKLPKALSMWLEDQTKPMQFIDSDMFSRGTPFQARWVGVINNKHMG